MTCSEQISKQLSARLWFMLKASIEPQLQLMAILLVVRLPQQMQWPCLTHISVLALALAQCTWMTFSAQAVRLTSLTAPEALQSAVLLSTHMQEYDVKVSKNIFE